MALLSSDVALPQEFTCPQHKPDRWTFQVPNLRAIFPWDLELAHIGVHDRRRTGEQSGTRDKLTRSVFTTEQTPALTASSIVLRCFHDNLNRKKSVPSI
jgi:hypothetical protein